MIYGFVVYCDGSIVYEDFIFIINRFNECVFDRNMRWYGNIFIFGNCCWYFIYLNIGFDKGNKLDRIENYFNERMWYRNRRYWFWWLDDVDIYFYYYVILFGGDY